MEYNFDRANNWSFWFLPKRLNWCPSLTLRKPVLKFFSYIYNFLFYHVSINSQKKSLLYYI